MSQRNKEFWERLRELGYSDYAEYLRSDHWRSLRRERLIGSRSCEVCRRDGDSFQLYVHHSTYARLGQEALEDLLVVCKQCHDDIHQLEGTRDMWNDRVSLENAHVELRHWIESTSEAERTARAREDARRAELAFLETTRRAHDERERIARERVRHERKRHLAVEISKSFRLAVRSGDGVRCSQLRALEERLFGMSAENWLKIEVGRTRKPG